MKNVHQLIKRDRLKLSDRSRQENPTALQLQSPTLLDGEQREARIPKEKITGFS